MIRIENILPHFINCKNVIEVIKCTMIVRERGKISLF